MNKKVKRTTSVFSILLSLVMLLSVGMLNWSAVLPKSEAATAGQYEWRVVINSENDTGGWNSEQFRVYGCKNNGTSAQTSSAIASKDNWKIDFKGYRYNTFGLSSGGGEDSNCAGLTTDEFPTKITYYYNFAGRAVRELKFYMYLQVKNSSGTWVDVPLTLTKSNTQCECTISGQHVYAKSELKVWPASEKPAYGTITAVPSSGMPKASSISADTNFSNQTITAKAKGGGTVKTSSIKAVVKDQYGVNWYQDPQWSITDDNWGDVTCTNGTGGASTVATIPETSSTVTTKTFKIKAARGDASSTITVTVQPTYTVKFDSGENVGTGTFTALTQKNTSSSSTKVDRAIPATYKPTKVDETTGTWTFEGWATSKTATTTGVVVPNGTNTIEVDNYDDTVYAIYSKTCKANYHYYKTEATVNADGTPGTIATLTSTTKQNTAYNKATTISLGAPTTSSGDDLANSFTVDGTTYTFVGWVTSDTLASATTAPTYDLAKNATSKTWGIQDADRELYGVYKSSEVKLSYVLGSASVASGLLDPQTAAHYIVAGRYDKASLDPGTKFSFTVNPNNATLMREGMDRFLGWRTDGDMYNESAEYENGDTYTITSNKTLYATFLDSRLTVNTYEYNGSLLDSKQLRYDSYVGEALTDEQQRAYGFMKDLPEKVTGTWSHKDANGHYFFKNYLLSDEDTATLNGLIISHVKGDQNVRPTYIYYPHSWVIDETYSVATCSEGGRVDRHCAVCGYTELGATSDPLGHSTQLFDVQAPTCTSDGRQGRAVCVVCYKVKCLRCEQNGVEDPFVDLVTRTVDGRKVKVCPVCGGEYDEVINPKVEAYGDVNEAGQRVHIFDLTEKFTLSEDGKTYTRIETYTENGVQKQRTITYLLSDEDGLYHRVLDGGVLSEKVMYDYDLAGNMVYTCRYCDRTMTVYSQSGLVGVSAVQPTCTEDGHIAYYTDGVNYYSDSSGRTQLTAEELVPDAYKSTGHNYQAVEARSATCTEPGYLEGAKLCSVCGSAEDESLVLPAAHNITEQAAEKAPTCQAIGNKEYYYCARCNKYFADSACTAQIANSVSLRGEVFCTACGEVKRLAKDENDHYIMVCPDVASHDDGEYKLLNTNVVYEKSSHTPAAGYEEDYIAPTCTTPGGRYWGTCVDCGAEIWPYGTIAALGHDFRLAAGKEATCTETGIEAYYKCENCGMLSKNEAGTQVITEPVVIEKTAHETEYVPANTPTCYAEGNTAYYQCAGCGAYFTDAAATEEITDKDSVVVGKTEHDYRLTDEDAGDCKTYSKKTYECSVCHDIKVERGNKGNHNYLTFIVSEATCGSDGKTIDRCTICGKEINEVITPATGNHTWGEWTDVDGQEVRECTVCHQTETKNGEGGEDEPSTDPENPTVVTGEKCPKCGLIHEGRTGIFKAGGLYCKIVSFIRRITGAYKG